jgi:hypothetical protein
MSGRRLPALDNNAFNGAHAAYGLVNSGFSINARYGVAEALTWEKVCQGAGLHHATAALPVAAGLSACSGAEPFIT